MRTQWPDEPLCRAQFHLSRVIDRQILQADPGYDDSPGLVKQRRDEAEDLMTKARATLDRLLKHHIPGYLQGAEVDELARFDHLQATFRGRWTGMTLLQHIPIEPGKAMAEG